VAGYVEGKTKNEILAELALIAQPGSIIHEQQKTAITVRCTEDIETAFSALTAQLAKNSDSNDRLAEKVFWLNVVITLATVVGAAAAVTQALK
jgi:hypothetical protein